MSNLAVSDSVCAVEIPTTGNLFIGHAELNVPSTLNSLSLAMVRQLSPLLNEWRQRDDIVAVVLTGVGDRAFCAGGDIQALYRAIDSNHASGSVQDAYPFEFFAEEYRLDYAIHTYPKPVITLGHGIVMGGGLGLFGGSSHRVVTETSRLAVPEITIGLFPDAGGTSALGRMDLHWASFIGLTGSHLNATDALVCGLATDLIAQAERAKLIPALTELAWLTADTDHILVSECLNRFAPPELPVSELQQVPQRQVFFADLQQEVAAIYALAGTSKWIDRGIANLRGGCPTTAGIVLEQLRRVPAMSLADTFRMELTIATHCAHNADFREGVRALLIDKDNAPNWRFGSIDDLDWSYVLTHFDEPWTQNPLADLEH